MHPSDPVTVVCHTCGPIAESTRKHAAKVEDNHYFNFGADPAHMCEWKP